MFGVNGATSDDASWWFHVEGTFQECYKASSASRLISMQFELANRMEYIVRGPLLNGRTCADVTAFTRGSRTIY
jgi:hypothetical protein